MRTWLGWSSKYKWVSRSLARDEWIASTSDEQIIINKLACDLALVTRAHDFLTSTDSAVFLRGARAFTLQHPPVQQVEDVTRIEDLPDLSDADLGRMRAIRDASAPEEWGYTPVMTCPTQLADAWRQRSGNDQARLIENHGPRRPWECLPSQEKQKASRPIATRGFVSAWLPCMSRSTTGVERVQRHELRIQRRSGGSLKRTPGPSYPPSL